MLKPLLIEIGVEELPAIPFLKELPNIEKKWSDILSKNSLLCEFDFYYTPRRLTLWHREFLVKQPDSFKEFFGAPLSIAYKDGKPTNAALSFAKKCGVSPKELTTAQKGGKEVLYYKKEIEGKESKKILPIMIDEFLKSLNFGKSMRWGELEESFIRPIRWVGVMLGDEKIEGRLYGVDIDNISYPHRAISYEPFRYNFAGDYFCKLDKNGVILYQNEREKKILNEFEKIEKEHNLQIEKDDDLLAEIVAITEYPTALLGSFDKEFLKLPKEVIITSMKEHQRYFPVFRDGKLSNHFIVVSNALCDDFSQVIKGNEKVLKARLSDAIFFYENDLKKGLNPEGLKEIVYMQELGSVYDKVLREEEVALYLSSLYGLKEEELIKRAVMLSKADLLSEMVYEFTELQGIMGYYYAMAAGEDGRVCLAIKEQYLPTGEDSELPSSVFSSIVALSNKLDTILSLFKIGKIPTGNKDPYGLRRAANGIVRIVLDKSLPFDIDRVFYELSSRYSGVEVKKVKEFFIERLYQFFDVNPTVLKAVLGSGERDVVEISKKVKALNDIVSSSQFKEIFSTFKRVSNIVKEVDVNKELSVDTSLFQKEQEKELYKRFIEIKDKKFDDYALRLDELFSLKPYIDDFFDNVMVNVEDEKLKNNRKNLIASIYKSFKEIADIKEITI